MAAGLRTVAALVTRSVRCSTGGAAPTACSSNGSRATRCRGDHLENRPNVTSDAAGLCLKSGNAALLRGSSTALRSNIAIAALLREALVKADLPEDVRLVEDLTHETATAVMRLTDCVDCLIPAVAPVLIRSIREERDRPRHHRRRRQLPCLRRRRRRSRYRAFAIIVNVKTQRTSVCNAGGVADRARRRGRRVRSPRSGRSRSARRARR